MKPYIAAAAILIVLTAAQAEDAMVTACMAQPSGLPQPKCVCLRNELRRRLTADEMRIEILAFQGKYMELRRRKAAMGPDRSADFEARVGEAIASEACTR